MPTRLAWFATALSIAIGSVAIAAPGPVGLLSEATRVVLVFGVASLAAAVWRPIAATVATAVAAVVVTSTPAGRNGVAAFADERFGSEVTVGTVVVFVLVATFEVVRWHLQSRREHAHRVTHDPLTGLLTRVALEAKLGRWIESGHGGARPGMFAVLYVDLDRFHVVNEIHGHEVGDEVLAGVGRLLRQSVRASDLVARLGADEFLVALPGLRDRATAASVAAKLLGVLSGPMVVNARLVSVSASIGIAVYPGDGETVASLLACADSAKGKVKAGGRNSYVFADVDLRGRHARRVEIERRLDMAVNDQRLRLLYQPIVDLGTRRVVAFEALLRWEDEVLGVVSPAEFIPIAEESGLIDKIGTWSLREACHQAGVWSRHGGASVRVCVNVSAAQFRSPGFLTYVKSALQDSGLEPSRLELELTESVLIEDHDAASSILRRLRRLGVATALDDFGTGYASLAYLQNLPINTIKIDRGFIASIDGDAGASGAAPIVDAVTAMGRALGMTVVAEGVESARQLQYLQRIGIERAQGYVFSRPANAADTLLMVKAQRDADAGAAVAERAAAERPRAALSVAPAARHDRARVAPASSGENGAAAFGGFDAVELVLG
jgi:diguanylate cyclase (GGDEF)-like protein